MLKHDFIKGFVEEENLITSGVEFLNKDAVLQIFDGFSGLSEVEDLRSI